MQDMLCPSILLSVKVDETFIEYLQSKTEFVYCCYLTERKNRQNFPKMTTNLRPVPVINNQLHIRQFLYDFQYEVFNACTS
jgi:hypothetical protein